MMHAALIDPNEWKTWDRVNQEFVWGEWNFDDKLERHLFYPNGDGGHSTFCGMFIGHCNDPRKPDDADPAPKCQDCLGMLRFLASCEGMIPKEASA